MNPLKEIKKEIKKLHKENLQLQQTKRELEDKPKGQDQKERKEPTLQFAGIKMISENEMETTKKAFQNNVWMIIQHKTKWVEKMKSNTIQHPRDIEVDKATIKAEFRDNKILMKLLEQIAEVKMSPYFKQVGPLAMILGIYIKQEYYNTALQEYVDMGQVTTKNAPKMIENASKKASKEADAEIEKIIGMESQETQDMWW
ncbi:hypothetical protein ACA910_019960 [Epithemia clementina (nom. ined.)]